MLQEKEFSKWLRRKDKTLEENLKFAIKAWQSVEFTLTTKYEMILEWLTEQNQLNVAIFGDFKELLTLRAQPGFITQKAKKNFVEWLLRQTQENSKETRNWCTLLQLLLEFELLQDLYRSDYELKCRVCGVIFSSYEKYLMGLDQSDKQFLSTFDSEFIASVLKDLKQTIKRCGDIVLFEKAYTAFALQPMAQVLLLLRTFQIDFFEELLDIESLLCVEMHNEEILNRIVELDLPVRLLCIECAVVKRKCEEIFIKSLLNQVFSNFLNDSYKDMNPSLLLGVGAYVIEMLARHNVSINIQMNKNHTAVKYLGTQIYAAVKNRKDLYLKEVLMLLCATLRLNPLILEQNVFEITANIILSPKSGNKDEKELFEEYLMLLMDMFRRLSRAEKFVANLLNSIKEQLKSTDLSLSRKRKAKLSLECQTSNNKKTKLDQNKNSALTTTNSEKYLKILFQNFFKPTKKTLYENMKLTAAESFVEMQNFWPSNPVGVSFSKIITGLFFKPSLTIWKTLSYSLKELIESLYSSNKIDENCLFHLDFQTALLAQYFAGCKLAEQSDKFLLELKQQREFTFQILKLFGQFILKKEHQPRTMSAFLELAYFASSFELLLIYYRPDGCNDESLQPLSIVETFHNFLTPDEWTLLEQRVLNFGKSPCKHLLHRLKIQKTQANFLLLAENKVSLIFKSTDPEILNSLLKTPYAKWYVQQLKRNEKEVIADFSMTKPELLPLTLDDLELLELVTLNVYENISKTLNSKHSLLKALSYAFDKIRQCVEITTCELLLKELTNIVINFSVGEYKVKNMSLENIKTGLDLLYRLPLGQLRRQPKTLIFTLHLSLYRDLTALQEDELSIQALEILKDILHFGQQVLIFKYFPISILLKLLPIDSCWELYEYLFFTIRNEERGRKFFLEDLANILIESQSSSNISEEQLKLLIAAIETLTLFSGPNAKDMRKHLDIFLKIFSDYLKTHFISDGTSRKDKNFVHKTLPAFVSYASVILTKATKAKESTTQTEVSSETKDVMFKVDEDFRRINKIYIGHSMDYRNSYAVRLMEVALNHRELLHLDQDEIEFVLTNYWSQIYADSKDINEKVKLCAKNTESAVKIIISNKTNEDLMLLLKSIGNNVGDTKYSNIFKLLTLIAKCSFSTIKGAIFNEQYKQIIINITVRLDRDEQHHFNNYDLVINILNCHKIVLDNKMIPIATDTMDSILSFLMDINIKKFPLNDANLKHFHTLHLAIIEVCASFIKYRHILLMDRVPQYMHIFKDLLQAIVLYKSERQKDTSLPSNEIDQLSELALKLEALMHLIAQHRVGVKRVAPFVLTYIINLMVTNKRPTTLYNKIKTHVENICYELVGICDHRVSRFILRCSNEAGRQLYEVLVKDYQKYHKFKGKV